MENSKVANMSGIFIVKDADQLLRMYIFCAASGFIAFILAISTIGAIMEFDFTLFLMFLIGTLITGGISMLIFKMIQSRKLGYVVDQNEGTLEFSAIGDPDDVSDYFNIDFYKKLITRRKINIDDIQQMSTSVTINRNNNGNTSYLFHMDIQGSFGSIPLTFTTEGKRDQLTSYIRSINRMGTPVIKM